MTVSRRSFVKSMGTGAAALLIGARGREAWAAVQSAPAVTSSHSKQRCARF